METTQQWNQLLSALIQVLIIPILPSVAAFIIAYFRKKTKELEKEMENRELARYLAIAENAVMAAVTAVNQLYVDEIRTRNGGLTPSEQRTAFEMAKEKALRMIGENGLSVLRREYGELDPWLDNRIEACVHSYKRRTSI